MDRNPRLFRINEKDNVAVALEEIKRGEELCLDGCRIIAAEDVERGHKLACTDIAVGDDIVKYSFPIGHGVRAIRSGEYVHTHNMKTNLGGVLEYSYEPHLKERRQDLPVPGFLGFVREDGSVGVRNEIWIITTVGCVNKTADILAKEANSLFAGETDGIFAFTHPYGCSQVGTDQFMTQRVLADMVRHPNAAGVLVLGLGCENNNIAEFKKVLGETDEKRVKFLTTQEVEDEIEEGIRLIRQLVEHAKGYERQECPVSKLVVGLKCGGSDAFSGITANPLLGVFSDELVSLGGTSILTEVPEMFGAETLLMERCINEDVFRKTVGLINGFKEYYLNHGQEVYENPSPGNKKGGITSLEEKSLGCTQKGGTGNVVDVLDYGEKVASPGLNLLKGPGNDLVAATALMAAGAQLILFTTGRGTPLGAHVPTIKVSSNTDLYNRKRSWIDFDAGQLLEGGNMGKVSTDFYEFVLKVASGEVKTRNEKNGYREIAILKDGVTL